MGDPHKRVHGTVGQPLPSVKCRIGDGNELHVSPPSVFQRYWRLPKATSSEFTVEGRDRWFRTGDSCEADAGHYRILGRLSADILKVNAFKVSALEIENFLESGLVQEIAVFTAKD